jgi:hypothetical protein
MNQNVVERQMMVVDDVIELKKMWGVMEVVLNQYDRKMYAVVEGHCQR